MSRTDPVLTIGMAVYNGEQTVGRAIESLLAQTFDDFSLLVSDNASTDSTESICRDYARSDDRVRYVRQPVNLGAPGNFGFLVREADTPLFMWAACDDIWHPTYVERNLAALREDPARVCSVSRVAFVGPDGSEPYEGPHRLEGGTFPLKGAPHENLVAFLQRPQCNSRFYGVFRTEVLRRCFSADERYLASDWVVMARTLGYGKHHEVPEVLMRRSAAGESSNVTDMILSFNSSWVSRYLLPMLPMTQRLASSPDVPLDIHNTRAWLRAWSRIACLNVHETRNHWKQLRRRWIRARLAKTSPA